MEEAMENLAGEPTIDMEKITGAVEIVKAFCSSMFLLGDLTEAEYLALFDQLDKLAKTSGTPLAAPLFKMAQQIVSAYQKDIDAGKRK